MFQLPKWAASVNGKMKFGVNPAVSAQVAALPFVEQAGVAAAAAAARRDERSDRDQRGSCECLGSHCSVASERTYHRFSL